MLKGEKKRIGGTMVESQGNITTTCLRCERMAIRQKNSPIETLEISCNARKEQNNEQLCSMLDWIIHTYIPILCSNTSYFLY